MKQAITIERRLPFGFRGDWGKVYKRYTDDKTLLTGTEGEDFIKVEKNYYRDLGQDVQFRETTDEAGNVELPNRGMLVSTTYLTVKTTDSYFDNTTRRYECVVDVDDIVFVFGQKWIVQSVNGRIVKRVPYAHRAFYIELKTLL